jgi:hypothetical protein
MNKSKRMGWVGHVAHMERREINTEFTSGNVKECGRVGDVSVDWRIIVKGILQK